MSEIIDTGLKLVATEGIKECVKLVINTYIKPSFDRRYKETQEDRKFDLLEDKLNEYMKRKYEYNLYMSTIVFKNQRKTINNLYVPLTVSKNHKLNDKDNVEICINSYKDDFIPIYKKVLLVDNAGMGKSTILKYLYLSAITENKGVPVLIELRRVDKNTSLINFIMNEINEIEEYFNIEDIISLIKRGGFIFFFDGYDEVTEENKKDVTENLQDFIFKTSSTSNTCNNFIISSRDENALGCFSDFQRFDIKPLTKGEAYKIIYKYDNEGELSKELIEKLENDENLNILGEFLKNPLMVSLLYKAFEYKRTVPYKKQIFYRQVYDALFEDHDRIKGGAYVHEKKSKLDIEDFHKVLRVLGFISLNKGISYCKEELGEMINKCKNIAGCMQFKKNDFIEDLTHSVPLFVRDGIEYRWAHKSFQEYFAASYICFDAKEKQKKYLTTMIEKSKLSKYYNVLDFCYDIDYKEFKISIIYPLIIEFIEFYNSSFWGEQFKNYDKENLDIIKSIYFIYDQIYIKVHEESNSDYFEKSIISAFERYFEDWAYSNKSDARLSIYRSSKHPIAVGFVNDKKSIDMLMNLLFHKKNKIMKDVSSKYSSKSQLELIKHLGFKEYSLNINNIKLLVQDGNLKIVNDFLIEAMPSSKSKRDRYILNYEECVKLRSQIEQEVISEEDIFL